MNIFELDPDLLARYDAFARSPTAVHAGDFSTQADLIWRSSAFRAQPPTGIDLKFEERTRRLVPAAGGELTDQCLRLRLWCVR
ncbi:MULTISPECIES: hypothetical protein [unclassified Sphingobium]|uniref:hypothetical protein n=1 Tax=unclassified Sphingobium TaxID=2611147 RepID=UPI0035A5A274